MIEYIFGLMVCFSIKKIADADNQSGWNWFGVTMGLCVVATFTLPFPYLRYMLAGIIAVVALIAYKMKKGVS